MYILQSLVFYALANPAPPAASVPAVADPVLPAPPAPPAQPAGAVGGQQERGILEFCVFFFFVLGSYLHRFCVVCLPCVGSSLTFRRLCVEHILACRVSALAKRSLVCRAQIGFAVWRL